MYLNHLTYWLHIILYYCNVLVDKAVYEEHISSTAISIQWCILDFVGSP